MKEEAELLVKRYADACGIDDEDLQARKFTKSGLVDFADWLLESSWIDVDERLPDNYNKKYLWQTKTGEMVVAERLFKTHSIRIIQGVWMSLDDVIAWRELPEPFEK